MSSLVVRADGSLVCLYTEDINLAAIGRLDIRRASNVEPDADGQWLADLSPANGPLLGPFAHRSQALEAEREWLERILFKHSAV